MTHRSLILSLALVASAAHAQVLKDPQWQAWLDIGKTAELTQAAQARLSAQPDDAQAAVALALAAVDEGQPARLEAVLKPVQACVDRQAAQAACFYALRPGDDKSLAIEARQTWAQLGTGYLSDKQFLKARGVFEQLMRDAPTQAIGPYGLARVMTETGQPDEAVKLLERARALEGADKLPIDHRLGLALIAKGDKPAAKLALERFVVSKRPNPRNLEDAKKRLAELG